MIDKETITLFSEDGSQASKEEVAMMAKMLLNADERLINAAINLRASERSAADMAEGEAKWCARASQLEKELQALREKFSHPAYWITYHPDTDEECFRVHSHSGPESCARRIAGEIGGYVCPVYHGEPDYSKPQAAQERGAHVI
ncbi:hypothetical protein C3408_22525 [Candidatus Pantoea alvi]|nr:hypothetical protein C3408_22525 [Pantoea alvi]